MLSFRSPQFHKWTPPRKNAMHPLLKEEQRVSEILTQLHKDGKIDEELYNQLSPPGSQPARLYGLAKVHKQDIYETDLVYARISILQHRKAGCELAFTCPRMPNKLFNQRSL